MLFLFKSTGALSAHFIFRLLPHLGWAQGQKMCLALLPTLYVLLQHILAARQQGKGEGLKRELERERRREGVDTGCLPFSLPLSFLLPLFPATVKFCRVTLPKMHLGQGWVSHGQGLLSWKPPLRRTGSATMTQEFKPLKTNDLCHVHSGFMNANQSILIW